MEFTEYQSELANYPNYKKEIGLYELALKIQEDVGELSGKIKNLLEKVDYQRKEKLKIGISIGNIMYDLSSMATELGLSLDEIISLNLQKLSLEKISKLNSELAT